MPHEMHHSSAEIEEMKDISWKRGRDHIREIEDSNGFRFFDQSHPEAFPEKITCVYCMDERLTERVTNGVFLAGSGILNKDKKKKIVKALKKEGVRDVTTHEGCGAVGIYAQKKGITADQAKKEARAWAEELSQELGGKYGGELSVDPEEYHVAQVAYYDMTGHFNPGNSFGTFPPGFVISRKYLEKDDALEQVRIGIHDIALTDHGYGKRFDKENRFYIVVVADNQRDLANGEKEVRKFKSDVVKIDGFSRR